MLTLPVELDIARNKVEKCVNYLPEVGQTLIQERVTITLLDKVRDSLYYFL